DHLRCKTPHRVRNEFYMHLVAYNLVRRVMALAAIEAKMLPWQISFKATMQSLNNFLPLLASSMPLVAGCRALVKCITAHHVGNRPDRFEPRRIKRRPKSHDLLRRPRHEYKRLAA
ncbi:MAG TPA: IS4 family transposase, partial [Pirellulales bacterium]|nr:IS4 family transposase [Pirellulales bacterium]